MSELPPDALPRLAPSTTPPTRDELEEGLRLLLHHDLEARLVQADLHATVKALVDTLLAAGAVVPEELERRRQRLLDHETARLKAHPTVKLAPAVDKYALDELPDIDCAALIPICKARCCKLTVCLSAQDLDERVMVWDYGKPYQIRKRSDGYCVHSEPASRRCGVYQQRPAICRSYDCRNDRRIWLDFERKIPVE
jgi:hypothetical protein